MFSKEMAKRGRKVRHAAGSLPTGGSRDGGRRPNMRVCGLGVTENYIVGAYAIAMYRYVSPCIAMYRHVSPLYTLLNHPCPRDVTRASACERLKLSCHIFWGA